MIKCISPSEFPCPVRVLVGTYTVHIGRNLTVFFLDWTCRRTASPPSPVAEEVSVAAAAVASEEEEEEAAAVAGVASQ
jgi:hypothetical protein